MTRVLHLSDTHVAANGIDEDGVDALASLERLLVDARHVPDLDLVVVSGDVSDDGSVAGCRAVLDRVAAFAGARGIPHVYCTGNHDARDSFREVLQTGHLDADGDNVGTPLVDSASSCAAVSHVGGLRVITLDSLVPGHTHGVVSVEQLTALTSILSSTSNRGTLLVLHHPPLTLASHPHVRTVVLRNIPDLAAVVAGSDVRAVLTGHLHFQAMGFLREIPVWVTPGVVTRIDTSSAPHLVRGVLGASATVVDLPDHNSPTFHLLTARDPRAGEEVYVYDSATGEDVLEA